MILPVDPKLREEARAFRFFFGCPSCANFDPDRRICSLGFPNEDHLSEELEDREQVIFCKSYELF